MVAVPLPTAVTVVVWAVTGFTETTPGVRALQLQGWFGIVSPAASVATQVACTERPNAVSALNELGMIATLAGTSCTVAVRESDTPLPVATIRVVPMATALTIALWVPLSAAVTIPGLRDSQVIITPGTELFWASRASPFTITVSCSDPNVRSKGVKTILPMRVRMTSGALETGALTCGTAVTVMLALPSRTPLASPVCDTRTFVLSEEIQTNVRPVAIGTFPASAVAVSCSVPLSPTVESPVITTEVSEEGPVSPPHAAMVSAAPSNRQKRLTAPTRPGHRVADQRSRSLLRHRAANRRRTVPESRRWPDRSADTADRSRHAADSRATPSAETDRSARVGTRAAATAPPWDREGGRAGHPRRARCRAAPAPFRRGHACAACPSHTEIGRASCRERV